MTAIRCGCARSRGASDHGQLSDGLTTLDTKLLITAVDWNRQRTGMRTHGEHIAARNVH